MKLKQQQKSMRSLINKLVISCLLLLSCAKEGALTGGEADSIPPEIIESDPSGDSTNIGNLNQFYFQFSERVDRKSFESNFYLQPFLKNRPRFDWSGWDEVTVVLDDTLKDETTYLVGVARGFKDLHNIPSASEYRFAISKSAFLDSVRFSGSITTDKKYEQIRLALFEDQITSQAKYITDIDNEYSFKLANIKASNFLHFFFNDKNRNFKYDILEEEIAFPNANLELQNSSRRDYQLTFTKIDTMAPVLQKMDTLENGVITLKFDEPLDLTQSKLFFTDSLNKHVSIELIGKGLDYFGYFDPFQLNLPLKLNYKRISDLFANTSDTLGLDFKLKQLSSKDTTEFKYVSINPKNDTELTSLNPLFTIGFSKSLLWNDSYRSDIQLRNKDNQNIPLNFNQVTNKEITFQAKKMLAVSENYSLLIQFNKVKSIYNESLFDSVYTYNYLGIPRNKFGSISFELKHSNYKNAFVKVIDLDDKKTIREELISTNQESQVPLIPAGRYLLEFYIDLNENKTYDIGFIKPFRYSEPYFFYGDTIPIRGGWENSREQIFFKD